MMPCKTYTIANRLVKIFFRESVHDEYILRDELIENVYEIGNHKVVVDIGAHIGGSSIFSAVKGAEVYAYEPSKKNFELLKKNVETNKLNIHCINKVVGSKNKLYHHDSNYGSFSHNPNNIEFMSKEYEIVDTISIQDVFKDIEYCDLLKSDCEGAEYEFVKDLPFEKIGRISMEFHGDDSIIDILKEHYEVTVKGSVVIAK